MSLCFINFYSPAKDYSPEYAYLVIVLVFARLSDCPIAGFKDFYANLKVWFVPEIKVRV